MRNDIIKLTDDEESSLSIDDYYNLGMQIHNLCLCDGRDERKQALIKLRYNLFSLPNKKQTWNDIIILANTKDGNLSRDASSVLFSALSLVPDKQQAWNDLLQLLDSEYSYTKRSAASALGYAFVQLQDKKQPWEILHKLADSNDVSIKQGMAHSLGYVFSQLQDRKQAWNDLHKLTEDPDSEVRRRAVTSLGTAFFYVPDKQQAWDDLHRLVSDDTVVRVEVATVLGFIFSYLPNKSQACTDLISMADEVIESDENVKTQANYSLGRVFVYLASKAKDDEDYKIKFDKAITHFRRAAENSLYDWLNPSRFCLPLYRLFYSVVFETLEGKEDTQEYLDEAERELETSGKKRQFIDIVKHLIAAANEIQNLDGLDIKEKRERLKAYKKHCNSAIDLMRTTEQTAPYLTLAFQRGLPILDKNIKNLIDNIQKTSKDTCKKSTGVAKEVACAINQSCAGAPRCKQRGMFRASALVLMVIKNQIFSFVDMLLFLLDFPGFEHNFL